MGASGVGAGRLLPRPAKDGEGGTRQEPESFRVGVVVPAYLRLPALADMTLDNLARLRPDYGWMRARAVYFSVYLVCTRLEGESRESLLTRAHAASAGLVPYKTVVDNSGCRSVAAAWNHGLTLAAADGCDLCLVLANDVGALPGMVEALVEYGRLPACEDAVWSGCRADLAGAGVRTEGCDFSCFAVPPKTLDVVGLFDENFRPAYFEDNDYCARVWLSGLHAGVLHSARFAHPGSSTIKADPEAAHHVRHWWPHNEAYFARKWGRAPAGTREEVLGTYNKAPFGDASKPLSWWPPPED